MLAKQAQGTSHQIAVLAARTRKLKSLPSNPFVVVVSPLKALIPDQPEPCQTLKLKAEARAFRQRR